MFRRLHTLPRRVVAAMLAGLMAGAAPAEACTNFLLKAGDGTPVYARTLEYALEVQPDVVVVPRNYHYASIRPNNAKGIEWTSRYAVVGVMSFGQPYVSDGMNEKGLAGGALYFPGFVGYSSPQGADPQSSLAPWEFLTWVLTNFSTVGEVKAALNKVSIIDLPAPIVNFTLPFHFPIHDASGASIV